MKTTESDKSKYGTPIPVRLPVRTIEELERESARDGIAISALIRRAVLRDLRLSGDDSNNVIETDKESTNGST